MVRGVAAEAAPGLGDGDRACGCQVAADVAVPLQGARDSWVVCRSKDQGEVARGEPVRVGEVSGPKGSEHRRHLLAEYGGRAAVPATCSPNRAAGDLEVERDGDGRRVAFARGSGSVDE